MRSQFKSFANFNVAIVLSGRNQYRIQPNYITLRFRISLFFLFIYSAVHAHDKEVTKRRLKSVTNYTIIATTFNLDHIKINTSNNCSVVILITITAESVD